VPSYNVTVTYANLPDEPGAQQAIFRELSALIDAPVSLGEISDATPFVPCFSEHGILQIVQYGRASLPYQQVPIKCDVEEKIAKVIWRRRWTGPASRSKSSLSAIIQPAA
jgi:penicillin-binding protein 2